MKDELHPNSQHQYQAWFGKITIHRYCNLQYTQNCPFFLFSFTFCCPVNVDTLPLICHFSKLFLTMSLWYIRTWLFERAGLKDKSGSSTGQCEIWGTSSLGACTVHTSINLESCFSAPVHTWWVVLEISVVTSTVASYMTSGCHTRREVLGLSGRAVGPISEGQRIVTKIDLLELSFCRRNCCGAPGSCDVYVVISNLAHCCWRFLASICYWQRALEDARSSTVEALCRNWKWSLSVVRRVWRFVILGAATFSLHAIQCRMQLFCRCHYEQQ